jgi:hypothetical protein
MWQRKRSLERELRENRPEPSAEFLRLAVGKMEVERGRVAGGRGWMVQPLFTLVVGVAVVAAFVGLGGFSGLKASVGQNAKLSPFEAAALNYCTETTTVTLAAGQTSPTTVQPINFAVDFHQPVLGFTDADVQVGGTAGGTPTVVVTSTGANTYNVAVSGLTSGGTVTVTIVANAATNVGGTCATQASNTATVTYSALAITAYNPDGASGNGTLSGSGAAAGALTVTVCSVNVFPCAAGNVVATDTPIATAGGTFTTRNFTELKKHTTYYAQAAQGLVTSQTFTFLTSG